MFRPWTVEIEEGVANGEEENATGGALNKKDRQPPSKPLQALDLNEVRRYKQFSEYPARIDPKDNNAKSNFRRQCKPYHWINDTLMYDKDARRKRGNQTDEGSRTIEKETDLPTLRVVVFDRAERERLLKEAHKGCGQSKESQSLAAHRGRDKTHAILKMRYFWPLLYNDVEDFCKTCLTCQLYNSSSLRMKDEMQPVGIPRKVMSQIGIDISSVATATDGKKHMVVAVDYFSKWVEARAVSDKTAVTVAKFLHEDIVCKRGCPDVYISDQGREFNNDIMTELCRLTGADRRVTSPYHPQANGMVERINKTLKNGISKVCKGDLSRWPDVLPGVLFAYRVTPHKSTKFSPFFLVYNRQPRLPIDPALETEEFEFEEEEDGVDDDEMAPLFEAELQKLAPMRDLIHDRVMTNIRTAQSRQKKDYDRRHGDSEHRIFVGQKVLLNIMKNISRKGGKFDQKRSGPYTVLSVDDRKNVQLQNEAGNLLKTKYPSIQLVPYLTKDSAVDIESVIAETEELLEDSSEALRDKDISVDIEIVNTETEEKQLEGSSDALRDIDIPVDIEIVNTETAEKQLEDSSDALRDKDIPVDIEIVNTETEEKHLEDSSDALRDKDIPVDIQSVNTDSETVEKHLEEDSSDALQDKDIPVDMENVNTETEEQLEDSSDTLRDKGLPIGPLVPPETPAETTKKCFSCRADLIRGITSERGRRPGAPFYRCPSTSC